MIMADVLAWWLAVVAAGVGAAGRGGSVPSGARTCSASALASTSAGWVSLDPEASVGRSKDQGIQFRYRVRSGGISLLARGDLDLTGCASLSLRILSSHAGGLAFGVSEADESRYGTVTPVAAGRFTDVRVNLDELQLAEDSKDEDGRLAPGPKLSLWFLDVAVFGQTLDPAVRGERTLWLDAVAFSSEPAPAAGRGPGTGPGTLVLDSFETGLIRWMPVVAAFTPSRLWLYPEGVELMLEAGGPELSGPSVLKARYPQKPMSAFVLSRDVAGLDLTRAERVVFWARTERPATFLVALEERAGARYEQDFELAAGRWQRVEVSLERFRLADDSRDANGRLDLASVKLLSIVAARLDDGPVTTNSLGLDEPGFALRAAAAAPPLASTTRSRKQAGGGAVDDPGAVPLVAGAPMPAAVKTSVSPPVSPPAAHTGPGSRDATMTVAGVARSYRLHLPAAFSASKNFPVVIALHGGQSSGAEMESMSGLSELASARRVRAGRRAG